MIPICDICKKPVRRRIIDGATYQLEKSPVTFVPDHSGKEQFINWHNRIITGREAADGQKGNRVHNCQKK